MEDSGKRHRVLAVDDDPAILEVIEAVLSDDLDVTTCASGARAVRLLESRSFHVVCSDYRMPGMNGVELLDHVAQLPSHTACLLLTGADEYIRSSERSPFYVILKPFEGARLLRLVLQLARIADMKRSVTQLSQSSTVPPAAPGADSEPPSSAPRSGPPSSGPHGGPPSSAPRSPPPLSRRPAGRGSR
jgi:DNA-binding NtrC family response regulator